jgi:hypothetical protein
MYTLKRIEELPSINHGAVKLAADDLGVQSFGLQVLDLPPGFADYPEHDHGHDGQEEVYVVLDGTVDLVVDGDRVHAEPATIVRVEPAARRKLVPGPHGARVLAIGCGPGCVRPAAFRIGGRA